MSKATKKTPVTVFTTGKLNEPSKIVQIDDTFVIVNSYTGEELESLPNIGDPAYDKDGKPILKNGKEVFYHGAILIENDEVLVHRTTPQQKIFKPKTVFVGNAVLFSKTSAYGGYQVIGSGLGAHDGPGGKTVSGWGPGSYGGYGTPCELGAYDGPGGATITGWGPGTTIGTSYDDISRLANSDSIYLHPTPNNNPEGFYTSSYNPIPNTSNTSSYTPTSNTSGLGNQSRNSEGFYTSSYSQNSNSSSGGWGPGSSAASYASPSSDYSSSFGDYSGPSGFSF